MTQWRAVLGSLMMLVGLGGFGLTLLAPRLPAAVVQPLVAPFEEAAPSEQPQTEAAIQPAPPGSHEITRLVIKSIGLDTAVTVAPLKGDTWAIPKFIAGHAQGSAGAGEPGNAILLGHVTSLTLGNVFEHLDDVSVDDIVSVFTGDVRFDYRVTRAGDVERTEVDVLRPTPDATLTVITCSGLWLPTVWDYSQRFVVRAELLR
jgi:LPXTG-site transpeptidase (sortase) family protein